MLNKLYASFLIAIAVIGVGYFTLSYKHQDPHAFEVDKTDEKNREGGATLVAATGSTTSDDDTPTYVFDNGDPNDPFQGDQFFGSMDKVGISQPVKTAIEPHAAAFMTTMAQEKQSRHTFLQNQGHQFRSPPGTWDVEIFKHGIVNGQERIAVIACLGQDSPHNGGVFYDGEAMVHEIWNLDANGQATLLDRSMDSHIGVQTQAEARNPTPQPPPHIPGWHEGTPDPNPNAGMGEDP